MPTNSDLKRWYKVYNVEQHDFVRYTDMFRIFCYDAVDDFHAVNLGQMNEAIKKAIQEHEYDVKVKKIDFPYGKLTNLTYDIDNGLSMFGTTRLTEVDDETIDIETTRSIPLRAIDGLSIDISKDTEHIEISGKNKSNATNLENGIADVLIQTTDANQSFKVMKDGRAKVATAPKESDDIVRYEELNERVKTFKYVDGPDDFTDVDGGLTVKKGMNVDGQMKANTAPKDENDVVRLKELKDTINNNEISDIDLNTVDTTVKYDSNLGITVNAKGTITRENGSTEQPTTKFEVPVVASDGIIINKLTDSEKIAISGKNFRKIIETEQGQYKVYASRNGNPDAFLWTSVQPIDLGLALWTTDGSLKANIRTAGPENNDVINKKYADDNYRKVVTGSSNEIKIYVTKYGDTESWMFLNTDPDGSPGAEIPQYGIGGTLRANMPTTVLDNSVVNKKYADTNYLKKSGGTITGDLIISGNLSASGKTSVIESTTLKIVDKLIYVAKDNTTALTSPAGLITPKYDGTNDGGLVYDNSGTAFVGDIKLDNNGNVDVNNSDLQPIATRDDYSNFTNGHKVKVEVDSSQKSVKFVDGGKDDGINSLTNVNLTLGDTTVQYDTTDGIQMTSTGRFTYTEGNKDATIDLDIPLIGTDGIVIDKASDSEKIEVSGKNFIKISIPGPQSSFIMPQVEQDGTVLWVEVDTYPNVNKNSICQRFQGRIRAVAPQADDEVVNRGYANDNYVKKPVDPGKWSVIVYNPISKDNVYYPMDIYASALSIPYRDSEKNNFKVGDITSSDDSGYVANKKYVDDSIANIDTNSTKYQHNLILEGTKDGFTFKAYMNVFRSDNAEITALDEVITVIGHSSNPCTGYIHDELKYYNIIAFDGSGPVFDYINPESGEVELAVTNDDVIVSDNVIEF